MKRFLNRFLHHFYLENAAGYFAAATALITTYSLLVNPSFGILNASIIEEGKWWDVALFAFRLYSPSESADGSIMPWISMAIYSYVIFFVGRMIEEDLGSPKFNLYLWSAIIHITIGAVLSIYYPLYVNTRLIYECLLIALAIRMPNAELFILPIRMKWIGAAIFVFLVIGRFEEVKMTGSYLPLAGLLFGFSNLVLFFGKDLFSSFRQNARANSWAVKKKEQDVFTVHRCYICGATEATNPYLEFRYCVDCTDHEYCENHLHSHNHIR
ncbi:hypothetical protein EHO59_06035 [Leptospira semungkisensis]|uniref:Rhomboid family intramembrane serine protease n=1 Tax=Leptospira semungkisensis TaxID=2484985 RepID=A0A4R9G7P6_9LEPT|nr:hypothetical protein [Leptospira semungkisensis]TGK07656.1 hypothetical protein EHO59_06035 [Leptospira semungkisensis]